MVAIMMAALLAQASPVQVQLGNVGGALPALQTSDRQMPTPALLEQVERALQQQPCPNLSATYRRFNITVPYAVRLGANGQATDIVVQDLDCPSIEALTTQVVQIRSQQGDFRFPENTPGRWLRGSINYNLQ